MSSDTQHLEHEHGHHEAPEIVEGRQRLGIWLFIVGDVVMLASFFFTYLYLRGTNTGNGWMTYLQGNSSAANYGQPVHEKVLSSTLNWEIVAVTVLSAAVMWAGEKHLRAQRSGPGRFALFATLGGLVALAASVLTIVQLRSIDMHIPYRSLSQNAHQFVYTAYGSAEVLLNGSSLVHLFLLVFLGFGLAIRASKGLVSSEGLKWSQARFVRFFWVWVAVGSVLTAVLTTLVNK
jgi:heme/copper-type cytochrome/quinol oxidase subunit 3